MQASARSTASTVLRPCAWPRLATVILLGCLLLSSPNASAAATPAVAIEPCSLLTLEEVGAVFHGPATQDRPHIVAINKVPVGGNCVYRSAQNKLIVINLLVDAYPGGHQPKAFENGRKRPHVTDLPGLGDRAFTITNPSGSPTVTFLKGLILVTVNVQGLGIGEAKQLATLVAARLPASTGATPPPVSPRSVQPSAPASQGSGKLDPALMGSWVLGPPNRPGIAILEVKRDATFSLKFFVGNRMQSGTIDGENGVLHLYPNGGGHTQELHYRIVDKNQMEWTDQKGTVTIARRQFR